MKRLLLVLMLLALFAAACGSPNEVEPSSADIDSAESSASDDASIETKVAATVAAALGQSAPAAPTEPAISGNATPLTPIPQLVDPVAEVSPEVEYAEPGQDGEITFDFGGGATAEAPTNTGLYRIGDLALQPAHQTMAVLEAQLLDSYEDSEGNPVSREGYKYVLLRVAIGVSEYLSGGNVFFDKPPEPYLLDQGNYPYPCLPRQSPARVYRDSDGFEYQLHEVELASVFPGYERVFDYFCEVPVTVADNVGRFRVQRGVTESSCPDCPVFDLSQVADTPAPELAVEEESHFELNEPITVLCSGIPRDEGGFVDANVVVTFSNARWTGRDYQSQYVSDQEPVSEIGMVAIDITLTNQGKADWPRSNFTGMPLEPGRLSPRFQTALDNALHRADVNAALNPVPPAGTTTATYEFGMDKRSEAIHLAVRIGASCTYNDQPYLIVRTGLPAYSQTGDVPSNDVALNASSKTD